MTLTSPVPTRVEAAASAPAPTARATIALAVLGVFVTYIPITGVSGALSTIAAATGATTSELQWVSDAYVIPMAAAVLSAGVFGDIHGRRRLFGLGMLLTVIGAVVAGLSATLGGAALPVLWFGQAVSGVGAGVLLPTTLALITHAVADPRQRPRYISMWATGIVVGLAIGPILSGLVLAVADWGWIFLPAGLLAVVAGIAAHVALPESRSPEGRHLDWGGQVTASIAIAALIFGVIEGGAAGWGSAPALLAFVVGGAALVGFIIRELRAEKPLMDLRMFRIIGFSAGAISTLAAMFVTVGEMFLLSIYLGSVQPLSALEIGIRLAFVPGVAALVNPIVPRLMARLKPLGVLLLGIVVGIVGMLLLLGVSSTTGSAPRPRRRRPLL